MPERAKPKPQASEIAIQTLFRSRARIQCPRVRIVAIPNGGKRGQRALNMAMREGMALGFPDIMCLVDGMVAFIEFKAPKGRISDNQFDWLEWLQGAGYPVTVSYDADHALQFLREAGFPFLNEGIVVRGD